MLAASLIGLPPLAAAEFPFFAYLTEGRPAMIAYAPSGFDPNRPIGSPPARSQLSNDLASLRPAFDGLILYGYRSDLTPLLVGEAAAQNFRAILLGVWDPDSREEIDGVAAIIRQYQDRMAFAVCIGNEGLNEGRYALTDIENAADRLRRALPQPTAIPLTTSEPAGDYGWRPLRAFGDFLAPNIHPAIDQAQRVPAAAAAWVRERAMAIARAADKSVLVKETGVPNGGAPGFTPEAQYSFWDAYVASGQLSWIHPGRVWVSFAAAFEAFDSPWKEQMLESAIEGHWGLLSAARTPYPAFGVWARQ